jgi:hypothetical protein
MCTGALLVCVSFGAGRGELGGAPALYWIGQALLIVPAMLRVLAPRASPAERVVLLTCLAALQSFLAWAYSPDHFRYPDELQHLRTAQDVLSTDHLFTANTYLSVSPGFPGMEIATAAVHDLTGLSAFHAGVLVVSVCHIVVPILVLGLVQEITGSPRCAAIAALVYGTAPHHAYYNTLFVYGAVALPFLLLALWAALRSRRPGVSVLAVLPPFIVVTITHHLSTALTVLALAALTVVDMIGKAPWSRTRNLLGVTVGAAAVAVAWTLSFSAVTVSYLAIPVRTLLATLRGGPGPSAAKVTAFSPPAWESLTSMVAAGATLLLIGLGVVALWRSSASRMVKVFSLLSMAYPLVLAVRVAAPGGAELASRGLTYVMVVAALPVGVALCWLWPSRRVRSGRRRALGVIAALAAATLMLLGGVTAGLPPWFSRVPSGFFFAGTESGLDRSVEAAGHWAARETQPESRVACDLSVCSVVASYARATPTTTSSDIYYGPETMLPRRLAQESLDYLYVDRRMTELLPAGGAYFAGDAKAGQHSSPLDPKLLAKFDTAPGVNRIYDNGFVQAYATRRAWS